jgi:hypothetical protein
VGVYGRSISEQTSLLRFSKEAGKGWKNPEMGHRRFAQINNDVPFPSSRFFQKRWYPDVGIFLTTSFSASRRNTMDELSRRDAIKLTAAAGAAVLGTAVLTASENSHVELQVGADEHPNKGTEEKKATSPFSMGMTTLFAVVDSNGTLCRSNSAISAHHLGTGQYEVIFNRNVRRGAYVASIGLCGSVGASPPGLITVVGRVSDVRGVFIETSDATGKLHDLAFHLIVITPEGFA